MTDEARRLADLLPPTERSRMLDMCADIDRLANQLADLERRGLGNTPEANAIRNQLRNRLRELAEMMKKVLTDKVTIAFATAVKSSSLNVAVNDIRGYTLKSLK
ncbi:Vinculin [Toxocara canis]|uniref:Vinculin n=1 Tax=Toxocara canis TaxID=6265 RepID=A0A0B2URN3_TOXCA|nr:Vinculin [Toxocara canis]